jgi:hypothetical protein
MEADNGPASMRLPAPASALEIPMPADRRTRALAKVVATLQALVDAEQRRTLESNQEETALLAAEAIGAYRNARDLVVRELREPGVRDGEYSAAWLDDAGELGGAA